MQILKKITKNTKICKKLREIGKIAKNCGDSKNLRICGKLENLQNLLANLQMQISEVLIDNQYGFSIFNILNLSSGIND